MIESLDTKRQQTKLNNMKLLHNALSKGFFIKKSGNYNYWGKFGYKCKKEFGDDGWEIF